MTYRFGVHVSHWDSQPQWGLLRGAGFEFAYIKATEPAPWMRGGFDPDYVYNAGEAGLAGLEVGFFHFYRNSVSPEEQARQFLAACYLPFDLPPALDVEDTTRVDRLEDKLLTWLSIVSEKTGKTARVYTSPNMIRNIIRPKTAALATFGLWLGQWRPSEPPAPAPWTEWEIWQMGDTYKGSGSRSGIVVERMHAG